MSRLRKFGDLIGVIEVSSSFVKFLVSEFLSGINRSRSKVHCLQFSTQVFATKNREILTCHEITIRKIDGSEDEEYDPIELWNAVKEVREIIDFSLFFSMK